MWYGENEEWGEWGGGGNRENTEPFINIRNNRETKETNKEKKKEKNKLEISRENLCCRFYKHAKWIDYQDYVIACSRVFNFTKLVRGLNLLVDKVMTWFGEKLFVTLGNIYAATIRRLLESSSSVRTITL